MFKVRAPIKNILLSGASIVAVLTASPAVATTLTGLGGHPLSSGGPASVPGAPASPISAPVLQPGPSTQTQKDFSNALAAIQTQLAAQNAARNVAQSSQVIVPDGLANGGLVVDPRVKAGTDPHLWVNASQPTQTTSGAQTNVTIEQTAPQAVLTWQSFNVGKNTTVTFDQQGNASWVALNRIDASGVPSHIQGQIKADGTVLLINPNGIIFDGSSQVNVHSLIASALDISSESNANTGGANVFFCNDPTTCHSGDIAPGYQPVTVNGQPQHSAEGNVLLTPVNEDSANDAFAANGLFTLPSLAGGAGGLGMQFSLEGAALLGPGGAITVEKGASITTSLTAQGVGGYVGLFGTDVSNAGAITTQNGQIMLATGSQIYLTEPTASATGVNTAFLMQVLQGDGHSVSRSLNAATINDGGTITNQADGLLLSDDGAITLGGGTIAQLGVLEATTSVTRPGSIRLDATLSFDPTGGNIMFGPSSVTAILPDEDGGSIPKGSATAAYFAANIQPRIDVEADGSMELQAKALIDAPGAAMTMGNTASPVSPTHSLLMDAGSVIDLGGLSTVLPESINAIQILVTANEVADTPLAQSLIGSSVVIDGRLHGTRADGLQWVGSPLLDASGYVDLTPESIDQLLSAGGSFNSSGTANFIQRPGSIINVSGGTVTYTGAPVNTTKLLGADGLIYDIGSANPNISYQGLADQYALDHDRWAVTDTSTNLILSGDPELTPGYVTGANAGSVSISANAPILEGDILAAVTEGDRQRAGLDAAAMGASLNITFAEAGGSGYDVVLEPQSVAGTDPYGASQFVPGSTSWTPSLSKNDAGTLVFPLLSDKLSAENFNNITINTGADVLDVPSGASLSVRPGGSINLSVIGSVDGALTARGGSITLTGYGSTITSGGTQPFQPAGNLVIGPDAVLNVSGLWVNDAGQTPDGLQGSAFINGGSITISTLAFSGQLSEIGIVSGSADAVNSISDTQLSGSVAGVSLVMPADATRSIVLQHGSVVDVSGGGYVGTNGQLQLAADGLPAGKGGNLSLQTYVGSLSTDAIQGVVTSPLTLADGQTIDAGSTVYLYSSDTASPFFFSHSDRGAGPQCATSCLPYSLTANVVMNGTIYAEGFDGGGTLSLRAPSIVIDGAATAVGSAISGPDGGKLILPPSFFAGNGFGGYSLTSAISNVTVTSGTNLFLQQSNYLLPGQAGRRISNLNPLGMGAVAPAGALSWYQQPTGAEVHDFAQVGIVPDAMRKPVNLTLTQQGGGTYLQSPTTVGLVVEAGAGIVDDPTAYADGAAGGSITLTASGMLDMAGAIQTGPQGSVSLTGGGSSLFQTVDISGSIVAPGGSISITGAGHPVSVPVGTFSDLATGALWIDDSAVLDVSGVFVPNPLQANYATGTVLDGGTITLTGGTIIAKPGARLLLDGAAATVQTPSTGSLLVPYAPQDIWSNGGTLQMSDGAGLYFSALVSAHGGAPLATGGKLIVNGDTAYTEVTAGKDFTAAFTAPPTSGKAFTAQQGMPEGISFITTDLLNDSGFDSATLNAALIAFSGSLDVKLPGSLTLSAPYFDGSPYFGSRANFILLPDGVFDPTFVPPGVSSTAPDVTALPDIGAPVVNLDAGYVHLIGTLLANGGGLGNPTSGNGTFNINAQWIDLQGNIGLANAGDVSLTSSGAIRLLENAYGGQSVSLGVNPLGAPDYGGSFVAPGNLTLSAAEIYPNSDTAFLLMSSGSTSGHDTLTVAQNGAAAMPLSAGGTLILDAQNIVQGGTLWAPLGDIVLGLTSTMDMPATFAEYVNNSATFTSYSGAFTPTKNVTLADGSLTSVSAAGQDLPYGDTVDGVTWNYGGVVLPVPPAKTIGLYGANIATQSGATIDAAGGGDIYATEFVSGTGGTRNVLASAGAGQTVYALVPLSKAKVAPEDPNFAFDGSSSSGITPGTTVTISGGSGIPAGTYVLMPGFYATLPGAYRVVQTKSNVSQTTAASYTAEDGSVFVTGTLGNALTGARSSQLGLFEIQSDAVWTKSSQINITSGTQFFGKPAPASGNSDTPPPPLPQLPIDGGALLIGATSSLSLESTNKFDAGTSDLATGKTGAGGQVAISASDILILASDQVIPASDCDGAADPACTGTANYLVLDADQISKLNAATVLIGGTSTLGVKGEVINPNAQNIEVETDAAHQLSGSELLLVTKAGANGITVDDGSVISAIGTVPAGTDHDLIIGSGNADTASGSLLRVSNGSMVGIDRTGAAATGAIAIGTKAGTIDLVDGGTATINGGAALTIDSSGDNRLASNVALNAGNFDLSGSVINIGGGESGLVLTKDTVANFAGAQTVSLRSASVINFYDADGLTFGNTDGPIGKVTFDGAGLYSAGGTTTIDAANVDFTDTQATRNIAGAIAGTGGTLIVNATATGTGTITLDKGATVLGGMANAQFNASQQIAFSGAGSMNAGAADITLSAPVLTVDAGSNQALTTTGNLAIGQGAGTAPAPDAKNFGSTLAMTAANISDSGVIRAVSGNVTLTATSGNIQLDNGAKIAATGSAIAILDQTEYTPGGTVNLVSQAGDVDIAAGATVDVSASGNGYAGTLKIGAVNGTVTLDGALLGDAAFKDAGGNFVLTAGQMAGDLPLADFTGSFDVTLQHGDIAIAAGATLTSGNVSLTANDGDILVDGTIDASGPDGGLIGLYGTGGVTIDPGAALLARYAPDDAKDPLYGNGETNLTQAGGTITLGTTGTPAGGTNLAYGYENVASSGAINVAAGAIVDVSGGAGGDGIDNSGGKIVLRAPILTDGTVNAGFHGTLVTNADASGAPSGQGIVLDGFAVWSTTDTSTGAQHFDGVIDPAGTQGANHAGFYQNTLVNFVEGFAASADLSGAQIRVGGSDPVALAASAQRDRPDIDLVNPSAAINGGNITVADNWNLGAGSFDSSGRYIPYYRTAQGEAGTLTLQAQNNVVINATVTDGFYETADAFGGSVLVANYISNAPQMSGSVMDWNTTSAASLMFIDPGVNNGSFSYDIVAGAYSAPGASANPNAVIAVSAPPVTANPTDSVIVSGATSYTDPQGTTSGHRNPVIGIPTLVRTGTGDIAVTAGGDIQLQGQASVYTAGAAIQTPDDFSAPAMSPKYLATPTGLVNVPTWAIGGGAVRFNAGWDLLGVEPDNYVASWYYRSGQSNGTSTPFSGSAQNCAPGITSCQTAAWINYSTFFQGIGALGGGNVSLTAGRDITGISASLPETILVSGGLTIADPTVEHFYGGGYLSVTAGGNLNSGDFLVGRGTGRIQVGGAIQEDRVNPLSGRTTNQDLVLAEQDGFINVDAQGTLTIGRIVDPAGLEAVPLTTPNSAEVSAYVLGSNNTTWGTRFTSYGPNSGVALSSLDGDVIGLTAWGTGDAGSNLGDTRLLPGTLDAVAMTGNVKIDASSSVLNGSNPNAYLLPTATGTINLVAAQDVSVAGLVMADLNTSAAQIFGTTNDLDYIIPLGIPLPILTQGLHTGDPDPVIVAAGEDINFTNLHAGAGLTLIKPGIIEAGHDVIGGNFVGQNNTAGDVTSIIAGNDIQGSGILSGVSSGQNTFTIYGSGTFLMQAGGDIGPLLGSNGGSTNGVIALGNGSAAAPGNASGGGLTRVVPYLPAESADIDVLFGVKPGINYQAAISQYVDPASAGTDGIDYLSDIATLLGQAPGQAWTTFQGLSRQKQDLLVLRAYLDFLTQVAADYRDPASPYFNKYGRAYDTIETLFPASYGYSDNMSGTGGNGAATKVLTGTLNISNSVLETQQGGDVNIIGPGGGVIVGSNARDTLSPSQEGILTLQGGNIRIFTDATVQLGESRIMTEQGGDIDTFSANGDINAGEGPKTFVSDPAIAVICDQNGYCQLNPAGLVTGAGVAALVTLPGQDPTKSNVTLVAPNGTVDAGAAGIRVAGNLNIIALQVVNAFNVQVGGTSFGLPPRPVTNLALTAASDAATSVTALVKSMEDHQGHTVVDVEVTGFGGDDSNQPEHCLASTTNHCANGKR